MTSGVVARPITYDDLYSIPNAHSAQIAPDWQRIVFVLKTMDPVANETESHLWLMNADGSSQRQITNGDGESDPRWSPSGTGLLYLADHEDVTQIWMLPLGEDQSARMLTNLPHGVDEYFCDGTNTIVAVSKIYPECDSDSCQLRRIAEEEEDDVEAMLFDRLMVRHYNHWKDGRINRPYLVDPATGAHQPLISNKTEAPSSLLGSSHDIAISPNGSKIAMTIATDSALAVWPNNDIFTVAAAGGELTPIATERGLEAAPRYSPDGQYLAYRSQAREGYESDQRDLVILDRATKTRQNLTEAFDRAIGSFRWDPSSQAIWFTAIDHGFSNLYRIDIATAAIETILDNAAFSLEDISPKGGYLVVSRSLSNQPYELFRYDIKADELKQLTRFSEAVTAELDLSQAEEFWFAGFNGDSVHGFLTYPPDFAPGQQYPLVLLIHGGPQWCWLGNFNYYGWNTQLMAAQGYVVAQIDPHGSVGYGLKFKEYVSGNWGKGEYEDLMLGVDFLLDTHEFLDSTRTAALGRSYGGFMTNWICGHTDRFRCLVTIDGSCNQISEYGTTEELWFPEWEANGTPYDNFEEYWRSSPIAYAENFKTPTMVIHGQKDYRVDIGEGLQMFTALQRQGVPSQFLYFPDEGHSVRKLKNLRVIYEHQLEWLDRWLNQSELE
jgi:dipeptidyl aminopeptidase/acylaminoacyl peptidase